MKTRMQRAKDFAFAVLGPFLGQNMPIFAGCATLFLLTASFPLLIWALVLVNHLPGYSISDVADLLCQFLPQVPEIQNTVIYVLDSLNAQSTTFVASFAAITTLFSASGGMTAVQKGLQRLTPGARFKLYDRLLAILYTVVFEGLLLIVLLLQGLRSVFEPLRALLSAIPQPNPDVEKNKVLEIYDPACHHYEQHPPRWQDIEPDHQVLCNEEELATWKTW